MRILISLAEVSYQCGLIGIDEFLERIKVANWLAREETEGSDPRDPILENVTPENDTIPDNEVLKVNVKKDSEEPDWLEFLFDGEWYFTISDPDPYPSTPHGHLNNPNNPWPKLNPYTGRAFKKKHQENTSMRLTKRKMRMLWRDQKFRSFCRNHILWYMEKYPHHVFPVEHPLRFPQW